MSVELIVMPDPHSKQREDNPYEDYMWMGEEEEEFEQDVLAQLEEEAFLEYCLDDMLEEEALGLFTPPPVPLSSSSSSSSSSTSTSNTTSSMPQIQSLNIGNANGRPNGHHGNGDIILLTSNQLEINASAAGDAMYETPWTNLDERNDASAGKDSNLSDSDSSEDDCPLR